MSDETFVPFPDGQIPMSELHYDQERGLHPLTDCGTLHGAAAEATAIELHAAAASPPIDGNRIRITVQVDGHAIVDMDLTRMYLRSKLGGENIMPFWFLPFVPHDDEDEQQDTHPVSAVLRLTIIHDGAPWPPPAPAEQQRDTELTTIRPPASIHSAPYGDELMRRQDAEWAAKGL